MSTGTAVPRKSSAEKAIPHTRIQDDQMIKDNYEVGAKIGQGNFGKVYAATHKSTGVVWAIKSINKEKAGSSALKLVEREVAILKRVNHPNIINLNEVIESPKRMYLVMELCTGGELADVLKEHKMFAEAETKQIMLKLAGAIAYLHRHGIVHRDLKLENILMGENKDDPSDKLHIKVTDFGLSVVKGGVTPDSMMQDFCGTPIYMAPEILDNKAYSQQCDVWALGIIMYTLLCGYPPFRAKDEGTLYDLIREAKVEFEDEVWSSVSEACKNCILGMLKLDPAHRLSAAEVLDHPWITGQERDTSQPTNVLEMMKMWKDELKNDSVNVETSSEVQPGSSQSSPRVVESVSQSNRGNKKASVAQEPIREKTPEQRRTSGDVKDGVVKRSSNARSPTSARTLVGKKASQGLTPVKASTSALRSVTPSGSHGKPSTTGNGVVKSHAAVSSSSKTNSAMTKPKKK